MKIKRITRNRNMTKSEDDKINVTGETFARVNVTILQVLSGVKNLADIVNEWSQEEKAAFMIAWRICQHGNARKLLDFAEMAEFQAKSIDPWIKERKLKWNQGDPDENSRD